MKIHTLNPDGDHLTQVRELAAQVQAADGVEAFGEQTLFNLEAGRGEHLVATEGQKVVGYAHLDHGSAELAVHPSARRGGVGRNLLQQVKTLDPGAAIWAHGNLEAAQGLAQAANLQVVRELLYMQAPITSSPRPPQPRGLTISTYTPTDAEDWVALNAEVFASHPEQGRLTLADLQARVNESWFEAENFWLARDDQGRLMGYMWVKREGDQPLAEIYVLGVSPLAQGQGLGKYLTSYALAVMAERGVHTMDLYVEGDNTPALATYTARGFTTAVMHVQYR